MNQVLDRIHKRALVVAGLGFLAIAVGAFVSPAQFFRSYLIGYLLWTGAALGCLALSMIHNLTGGAWGRMIRAFVEGGTRTLPFMAVLAVPLLFGMPHLYEWARPEAVAASEDLRHKAAYLNIPFFAGRLVVYFAVWIGLTFLLARRRGGADDENRLEGISGPGLVFYGLTVTFASIDLAMSTEPAWLSTIFGMLFMVGQVLNTLAIMIATLMLLAEQEPLRSTLGPSHYHDLGNLMLAFVMLWAYASFSQFLIIWSGNLPEEITWYLHRMNGGWGYVAGALLLFHFAVPFLLLLSRANKKSGKVIGGLAMAMIFMRFVDILWVIEPSYHPAELHIHWMDVAAAAALGGLWVVLYVRQVKARPPVAEGVAA